jgi:hypothetical protein
MGNDNRYSFIQGRITIANLGIQPSSPLIHTTPQYCIFLSHTHYTLHSHLYGYARIYNIYHSVTQTDHE